MTENHDTQAARDVQHALTAASNCLQHEPAVTGRCTRGDGGSSTSAGSTPAGPMPDARRRDSFAKSLLAVFDADVGRLHAAAAVCRSHADRYGAILPGRARRYGCAAELCEHAARLVVDAGAVDDDRARRRLLAIARHDARVGALGRLVADDARRELEAALAHLDGSTPSRGGS